MADATISLTLKAPSDDSFTRVYEQVKYQYLQDHFNLFNTKNTVEYFLGEEDLIDLHQITLYGSISLNISEDFTNATLGSRGNITDYDLSLLLQAMVNDSISTALLSITQVTESGSTTTYYPSAVTDYSILQTSYAPGNDSTGAATQVLYVRYKLILTHSFYRMKTSIGNYVYANNKLKISNVASSIYKDNGFVPDLHFEYNLSIDLSDLAVSNPVNIENGVSIFTNGNFDYIANEIDRGEQNADRIAHEFRIQYNETDYEFLSNLYRERGIYMVKNDLNVYHVKVSYSTETVNLIEYLYRTTTYYNSTNGLATVDKLNQPYSEDEGIAGTLVQYVGLSSDYNWGTSTTVDGITTRTFSEVKYAAMPIMKYTITDIENYNTTAKGKIVTELSYARNKFEEPYIHFVDSKVISATFPSKVVVASYTPDTDTYNRYGQDPQPVAEVCYAIDKVTNTPLSHLIAHNISLFPLNPAQTNYVYIGEGEKYYYESFIQSKSEAIRGSVHRMQESISKGVNIQFYTSYHNLRPSDNFNIVTNSLQSDRKLFLNQDYYITSTKIYAIGSIGSIDLAYEHEFKEVFRHIDSLSNDSIRDTFVQIFTAIYDNTKYRPAYDPDSRKVINTSLSAQIYLLTDSNQMVKDTLKPTTSTDTSKYDSFTDSIHYYPVVNEYGAYPIVFDFEQQESNSTYRGLNANYHYANILTSERETVRASTLYAPKAKILSDGLDTVGESLLLNHGQEIMVSFLGSKADRPFISGVIQPDIENPLINHFTNNKIDYLRTPITNCGIYFNNNSTTGSHILLETNGSDLTGADVNGDYSYNFMGENYMEIGDPTVSGRGIKIGTEIYSRNVAQGLHENYFTKESFVTSAMNKTSATHTGVHLDEQAIQLFPFNFDATSQPDFSAMRNWAFPIIHKRTVEDLAISNYNTNNTETTLSDDTFDAHYNLDAQKYTITDSGLKETLNLILNYSSIYGFLTDNAQYLFSGVYYPYKSSNVQATVDANGEPSMTDTAIYYESLGANHQYETVQSATYHLKSQHNNLGHYRRQIGTSHLYLEGKEYNFYDNSNQKVYIGPQRDLYLGSTSNDMQSPISITSGDEDNTFAREFRGINYVRNVIGKKYELTEGSKKGEYDYLFFKVIDSNEMTSDTIENIGKTGVDQWRTESGMKKLAKHAISVGGTVTTTQGDNGYTTLMDGSDMCTFTLNGAQVKKFRVMQFNLGIDMSMYLPAAITSLSVTGNHALLYLVAEDWDVCVTCLYVMATLITVGTMEINIRPMKIDLGKNANGSKELFAGIYAGLVEVTDSYSQGADCFVNGAFFYENCALKKADALNSNNL